MHGGFITRHPTGSETQYLKVRRSAVPMARYGNPTRPLDITAVALVADAAHERKLSRAVASRPKAFEHPMLGMINRIRNRIGAQRSVTETDSGQPILRLIGPLAMTP